MKEVIVKYKIFKFNELSQEVKDKVIEANNSINVDHDWWIFMYDDFHEQLKDIGIKCSGFSFDIDRDNFIAMDNPVVEDEGKFLTAVGIDTSTEYAKRKLDEGIHIRVNYGSHGRTYNYISIHEDDDDKLNDFLESKLNEFIVALRKEAEHLTSAECIQETIEANEFLFHENGDLFLPKNAIEILSNFNEDKKSDDKAKQEKLDKND